MVACSKRFLFRVFSPFSMARIWYSVCGEGMGHAVRSHAIISELEKRHKVLVTAAERAYPYLSKRHKNVYRIFGNTLVYRNNSVIWSASVAKFLLGTLYQVPGNLSRIHPLVTRFKPELVISDFESAAHYLSKLWRLPCISIDNIHALSECRVKAPWFVRPALRIVHSKSDHYLIMSFASLKVLNPNAKLVPPVIRPEIRNASPSDQGHVLVYQTTATNKHLIDTLRRTKNSYVVYGFSKRGRSRNILFREFSEQGFIEDLAGCKYVILNGGFTLITEALYLKKPILSIPVRKQYEQELNANLLEQTGVGCRVSRLKVSDLLRFESGLGDYLRNMNRLEIDGNDLVLHSVDKLIKRYLFI
jgi:uncharacterized protein (TIGR00661 family)